MGNHKFKLSDVMPNAWFHKLKDMGRSSRNQSISQLMKTSHHRRAGAPTTPKPSPAPHPPTTKQPFLPNRASYYYSRKTETEKQPNTPIHPKAPDTHFSIDSPRKSKKSTRKPNNPSIKLITSSATDIIMDMGSNSSFVSELQLPPILTKPVKKETGLATFDGRNKATKKESNHKVISTPKEQNKTPTMRSPAGLHRIRMRASSPRIASKKIQACRARRSFGSAKAAQRQGLSESFAVVKLSSDPRKDFRDSMVEMIVENNMRASKDLEELLACYLALNSNEYHDVIVKVFEQIWCDLTDIIKLQVS